MEHNERVEKKIDKIAEDITTIKVTLGKQHVVLVEHESRSRKLEDIVLPIQRKFAMLEGALKFIGILSVLAAIIEVIIQLVH